MTRLSTLFSPAQCATIHRIFVQHAFDRYGQLPYAATAVFFAGSEPAAKRAAKQFANTSAFVISHQRGSDLGSRLRHASQFLFRRGAERIVFVGTDSPTLPQSLIRRAFHALKTNDVVLLPARDGGYCLIGLRRGEDVVFSGIDWSTEKVFQQTMKRASKAGLSVTALSEWYDVDRPNDWKEFEREICGKRAFAKLAKRLRNESLIARA